jgi:O-acetyl-ADP-ribose deacetylase
MSDTAPVRMDVLFARGPFQWGLRGDPHAWEELRERLGDDPLPASVFDVRPTLLAALEDIVGQRVVDGGAPIYVARFDPGHGMSAGHVDPTWWVRTGIPILIDRFEAVRADG